MGEGSPVNLTTEADAQRTFVDNPTFVITQEGFIRAKTATKYSCYRSASIITHTYTYTISTFSQQFRTYNSHIFMFILGSFIYLLYKQKKKNKNRQIKL